ncbi:hypothetical protein KQI68_07310 [Peptoniphilus sp. MSJ-1]|uniref:Uncharacterized protein n=1 Tax=Peptoniphilus ovalis TaxID=2841503 RepID=A0ABS6FJH1_9FIRM|nr:hypothetical protein [Peptoniphilus ovalis]MBU5669647.1 hypothetical protein [Peptoniphilus ovalis]
MSRPLNVNSKAGLVNYIENTPSELPFVEECWEVAVAEAKVRNEQVAEFNRLNPSKRKRVAVSKVYFEFLKEPRFKKQAEALYRKKKGIIEPSEKLEEFKEEIEKNKAIEEEKESLNFEDFIDDINSNQGQFILKLLNMYFVELYDADSIKFIISRIKSYYGEYELNSASDEYLVITAISDELVLRKMNRERIRSGSFDAKEMKTVRDSYMSSLDGLKVLKKFNQDNKDKENLFAIWSEKLVKSGDVEMKKKEYTEDQIDFILKDNIDAIRRSFNG